MQMETPSSEAAERETRICWLSVLHSPMLLTRTGLPVPVDVRLSDRPWTRKSVVWSLLRPSSVLGGSRSC